MRTVLCVHCTYRITKDTNNSVCPWIVPPAQPYVYTVSMYSNKSYKESRLHRKTPKTPSSGEKITNSPSLGGDPWCRKFFYNVFRATRSKTTSLPAALNQARRIDTLDEFYLYGACKTVLHIIETIVIHCYVMRSDLKIRVKHMK